MTKKPFGRVHRSSLEDVPVGVEFDTSGHTVTQRDILLFADVTRDHHPLHTDEEFCRSTQFGRPIAHGLYGLSLMEGLKASSKLYEHTSVASLAGTTCGS